MNKFSSSEKTFRNSFATPVACKNLFFLTVLQKFFNICPGRHFKITSKKTSKPILAAADFEASSCPFCRAGLTVWSQYRCNIETIWKN